MEYSESMIHPILIAGLFDWLTDTAKGIASAILSVVGRLLASFFSFFNDFACGLIDIVALFLPQTPPSLQSSTLAETLLGIETSRSHTRAAPKPQVPPWLKPF